MVRTGALGDTLMATPVVPALAERYPGARIDMLVSAAAAPLVAGVPGIARVLPLRQRNWPFWLSPEKQRLVGALRAAQYERAIVLEHAARYYELAERARVSRVTGFRETPFDPRLHSIANNLRAAGFDDYARRSWRMLIALDTGTPPAIADLVREAARPLVGLHVGYGPLGRKKDQERRLRGWPLENFGIVGRALVERGATLVLTGAAEDRPAIERLAAMLPRERVIDGAGRCSLGETVALVRQLDLLVSVDSGPAHIAAAVGTPLIVLWGPGILDQTRPVSMVSPVDVLREPVECAPCYGTPMMKACRRNICMEGILPDRVIVAIERRLATARPSLRPPA